MTPTSFLKETCFKSVIVYNHHQAAFIRVDIFMWISSVFPSMTTLEFGVILFLDMSWFLLNSWTSVFLLVSWNLTKIFGANFSLLLCSCNCICFQNAETCDQEHRARTRTNHQLLLRVKSRLFNIKKTAKSATKNKKYNGDRRFRWRAWWRRF